MADQLCCDHQETEAALLPVTDTLQNTCIGPQATQQHSKFHEDAELREDRQTVD